MAGKHSSSSATRERPFYTSRFLILTLSLISLILLIFFISYSSSPSPSLAAKSSLPTPNPNFEYSFVVSLEHFLTKKLPRLRQAAAKDDTVTGDAASDESVARFDDSIWRTEIDRLYQESLYPASSVPVRVYVYEMPDKFTYDLLWLFRNSYKDTDNLTLAERRSRTERKAKCSKQHIPKTRCYKRHWGKVRFFGSIGFKCSSKNKTHDDRVSPIRQP